MVSLKKDGSNCEILTTFHLCILISKCLRTNHHLWLEILLYVRIRLCTALQPGAARLQAQTNTTTKIRPVLWSPILDIV